MAGHSKWANIKHRKERADAIKGKIFSRIIKELMSAVKQGGPDPKSNSKLRIVIQKAKAANIPSDNIERNIKKASSSETGDYHEFMYELYGYGGVGIIAEVMTDNKNRISSDIRIATNKKGGTIANPGAVAFNFDKKGIIEVPRNLFVEDELFLMATESGAEDFEAGDEVYIIVTAPEDLFQVKENLEARKVTCKTAEMRMIPKTLVECDEETKKSNLALIEYLEDLDDVDTVYHNMVM